MWGREGHPREREPLRPIGKREAAPRTESAPRRREGTGENGGQQRPWKGTRRGQEWGCLVWFPLEREKNPDSAVIKKQTKTIFGLKRSHSRVKIVILS